jgi:IclR helix-turn-helix domain
VQLTTEISGSLRAVVRGAFELLASVHGPGPARVSDLQRATGLPRTTVYRLLTQLEESARSSDPKVDGGSVRRWCGSVPRCPPSRGCGRSRSGR